MKKVKHWTHKKDINTLIENNTKTCNKKPNESESKKDLGTFLDNTLLHHDQWKLTFSDQQQT